MKEYYVHRHGYLLKDETNVYLTQTGNWSEIPKLKERRKKSIPTESFKIILRRLGYVILVYLVLDAIKMNSMKTIPTQVFLVSVLLWSVFFFFINEILVLHSSLAALKEKIADGFTFKIIVYILGGFLMAYISRYIKRRENTTKINK